MRRRGAREGRGRDTFKSLCTMFKLCNASRPEIISSKNRAISNWVKEPPYDEKISIQNK